MARSKAYLFRGMEIRWACASELLNGEADVPAEAVLQFPGGVSDYLKAALEGRPTLTAEPFQGEAKLADGAGRAVAL